MSLYPIASIHVPVDRFRNRIDEDSIQHLMDSISRIGLRHPISIRTAYQSEPDDCWYVVAGAHRLEACKRLGWSAVECEIFDGTHDEAEMWEISENLHRAELTEIERADQLVRWMQLAIDGPVSRGGRGNKGGINAAAKELYIPRSTAQRLARIASISPTAKQAAIDAGLANDQRALLEIAKAPSLEAQVEAVKAFTTNAPSATVSDDEFAKSAAASQTDIMRDYALPSGKRMRCVKGGKLTREQHLALAAMAFDQGFTAPGRFYKETGEEWTV
jgi:hypothetical protein